jgi:hypothetical protein
VGIEAPPEMEPSIPRPFGIQENFQSVVHTKGFFMGVSLVAMATNLGLMWFRLARAGKHEVSKDYQATGS